MKVVAIVPAHNEAGRVAPTVRAIRAIEAVDDIVVVDDGSTDETAAEAAAAGVRVLRVPRRVGKGGAVDGAMARLGADVLLLLDADLGESARAAGALLRPVLAGDLDMAIGALPRQEAHGGFRLLKRLTGSLIHRLCGFRAAEPMSGQRALNRRAVAAVRPLATGFGVELGMTVDAVRAGCRVGEVPVEMGHRATGRDLGGILHRARQAADVLRAAAARR